MSSRVVYESRAVSSKGFRQCKIWNISCQTSDQLETTSNVYSLFWLADSFVKRQQENLLKIFFEAELFYINLWASSTQLVKVCMDYSYYFPL